MEDQQQPSESSQAASSCVWTSDCSNFIKIVDNDGELETKEAVDFGCSFGGNHDVTDVASASFVADTDDMAASEPTATVPDTCATSCTSTTAAAAVCGELHEGIDRLLVRHRNEIMFELRRLQFGDRPVTGDSGTVRRQAVDRLVSRFTGMTSQLHTTQQQQQAEPEHRVRPEQVVVEVNALVEQRPVSSILQSTAFRSSIERSLRGALNSLRRDNDAVSPMVAFARQQRRAAAEAAAAAAANRHSSPSPSVAERAADGDRQSSGTPSVYGDEHQPQGLPVIQTEMGPDRTVAWLQQNPLNIPPQHNDQSQVSMNEVIEQMQHENVISEISELIQAQLVTSALDGPIREVLERQMRNRLEDSGMDGVRVQQLLRQLPRNNRHRRNDFWELGIMAPGQGHQNDNVDNISVISATAAVALPQSYTQSNMALSHEVRTLQRQVTELKTMLQLSFDLQLDIQRSIRQEVAAAVSATLASAAAGGDAAAFGGVLNGSRSSRPPSGSCGNCLICLDKPVDTVLYQCGHMCLCYTCGMLLRQRSAHCPVCRAPIRDIIRAYHN